MSDKYICRSCGQALNKDSPLERALAWVKSELVQIEAETETEGAKVKDNDDLD